MYIIKKAAAVTAALTAACLIFCSGASATWYDEVSGGSYAKIEGDPYVADTFCGVEALYSESTYQYQCNELIMRFYDEAYNLSVMAYMNAGLIMLSEGYEFRTPSAPKKGDIIYSPAKFRNNSSDHWAIVKDYSNGKITLFEQNVVWEGKAGTGRKLSYPSDWYYLYTPVAKPGYPDPVLRDASTGNEMPQTEPSTAAPATKVTTTKETTAKVSTTKPVTTKPATTKATTAKAPPVTTAAQTSATTSAVTAASGTAPSQSTAQTFTETEETPITKETGEPTGYFEITDESETSLTEAAETEPSGKKETKLKILTAALCAVLAAAAGTLIIIINKARKNS